ncbi:hypothetical protein ACG873_02645 [Mesorhizobium sp. AaZ16]|uniref:hypothetical protein n=1 Tax=Mesorhizobium sp. AaZ16 TaxID=3402289 RepID=UPI00374E91EB
MQSDVIIIGGSYSGMAAALQLLAPDARGLGIGAGLPRNRFASHSHGFSYQHGLEPAEIAKRSREQLSRYETLAWHDGTAEQVEGSRRAFGVLLTEGRSAEGRLFRYRGFTCAASA